MLNARNMKTFYCYRLLALTVAIATGQLNELIAADAESSYVQGVRPVLHERCWACHGALRQEAGLRLDSVALILKGGETGPGVIAGNSAASLLLEKISGTTAGERMPPEGEPLKAEEIAAIRNWIDSGAIAPANDRPEPAPSEHWSYVPPTKKVLENADLAVQNPIDAWLEVGYQKAGLEPTATVDKATWLRRATIDLVGYPPTLAEIEQFLGDHSSKAEQRVIDRLLDDPAYGQRWARHWMDVWRYSEAWGLGPELRNSQKHMWHFRDWIVDSLNADLGYDQMVQRMLAADELFPNDLTQLAATGFLARPYFRFNRQLWMDEVVEHTAKAFLGITVNCAKCHDHKYDPIKQTDFYQFRAFFEPYQLRMEQVSGQTDFEVDAIPRAFDCNLDAATYLFIRGDERRPDTTAAMQPNVPELLRSAVGEPVVKQVNLPLESVYPELRPHVLQNRLAEVHRQLDRHLEDKTAWRARLDALPDLHNSQLELTPEYPKSVLTDNFQNLTAAWQPVTGDWAQRDGQVQQTAVGMSFAELRLKDASPELPQDFEATVSFQILGGQVWKSAGLAFDVDPEHAILAYVSANSSRPSCAVAFREQGRDFEYPQSLIVGCDVPVDQPVTLTLRVRGNEFGLFLRNELRQTGQIPVKRRPGRVSLMTFDAQCAWSRLDIRPLAPDEPLNRLSRVTEGEATREELHARYELTELTVSAKELQLVAIQSADLARRSQLTGSDELSRLKQVAKDDLERWQSAEANVVSFAKELKGKFPDGKLATSAPTTIAATTETLPQQLSLRGAQKVPESNLETIESQNRPFPETSTGRRTALAKWITDRRNPLAARVAVNHLWTRHFGQPLANSVFDLGRKPAAPNHAELLDWLAVELMEQQWSMKQIHRLIVTSKAYRRAAEVGPQNKISLDLDPDNRWQWRMPLVRMESQVIRDSLLRISGMLDVTPGGPSIPAAEQPQSTRRSLYFAHSNNDRNRLLNLFDEASVQECYRRSESIVPQQSLALFNSELAWNAAVDLAASLASNQALQDRNKLIDNLFWRILTRAPTAKEIALCQQALADFAAGADPQLTSQERLNRSRAALIHTLFNHHDFISRR